MFETLQSCSLEYKSSKSKHQIVHQQKTIEGLIN